jgi:hypothetical protein
MKELEGDGACSTRERAVGARFLMAESASLSEDAEGTRERGRFSATVIELDVAMPGFLL